MTCPAQSLVPVSTEKVANAAKALRTKILAHRIVLRDDEISEVMRDRKIRVGWFTRRPVTREEAIDIVDNEKEEHGWPVFTVHRNYGIFRIGRADQLLSAATLCQSDTIYLSLEDAELVGENLT